ncbi:unnamed protein product [Bursaphelenchus xylophilus]|uniref:(pine wood nematode) hypothetical protein n=1 Tax=Bursaphelenchus xylophilus TaxID=6326 RepID=A0A1I7SWQ9_BURXY|nr:unnamed protein product [Bursaphelenchus xylophilus]CAG9099817.1 unnamed protein product [Bursaphelenchus xylophilus]
MRDDIVPRYQRNSHPDNFSTYRKLCENRVRRLERYKKSKSFCSLDDISSSNLETEGEEETTTSAEPIASSSTASTSAENSNSNAFQVLKEKMISLMENDVQLLQKLLTLGDTIQELREKQGLQHRSSSETSLSSNAEEDDEWRPMVSQPFSASMSAITRLYVDDVDDDDPDVLKPNVQYFSRKNSILRIPIPPRASNRYLGRRLINRDKTTLCEKAKVMLEKGGESDKSSTLNSQSSQSSQESVGTTRNGVGNSSRNSDASLDSGIASASIDAV